MKTTILNNVNNSKELQKEINKLNHFASEQFINMALTYIKAIKERRMLCSIGSVSASGMSRTIKFTSCEKGSKKGHDSEYFYYNYYCLFRALGYKEARAKNHYFTISGCGMDMIFHTNYSIIHDLKRLGFISDAQCRELAQMTPTTI